MSVTYTKVEAAVQRHPQAPAYQVVAKPDRIEVYARERMCYAGGIDDWLTLGDTGQVAELAADIVPTLGTNAFYELW
jgi:hypothetical protein